MGKIFDLLMSGSWKEYQEIRTLKTAREFMEKKMSNEDLKKLSKEELIELLKKGK